MVFKSNTKILEIFQNATYFPLRAIYRYCGPDIMTLTAKDLCKQRKGQDGSAIHNMQCEDFQVLPFGNNTPFATRLQKNLFFKKDMTKDIVEEVQDILKIEEKETEGCCIIL